jgi:hypothetical protein
LVQPFLPVPFGLFGIGVAALYGRQLLLAAQWLLSALFKSALVTIVSAQVYKPAPVAGAGWAQPFAVKALP